MTAIRDPPGYSENPKSQTKSVVQTKRAWDVAYAGAKSIPMNLIMMYMSGNSIQIFSIIITVMMFWNPIKAIMSMNQAFHGLNPTFGQQLVFCLLHFANMLLAIYKCYNMGLLQFEWQLPIEFDE